MKVPTVLNPPRQAPNLAVQGIGNAGSPDAGAIALEGVGNLAAALERNKKKVEQDQLNLDRFELDKTYLEEVVATEAEFNSAVEQAPEGAPNFAQTYTQGLQAKHEKLLEEMKGYGYGADELHDFEVKLGTLRAGQFGNALKYQNEAERVKAGKDFDTLSTTLSQYYRSNPGATASVKEQWNESVDQHPHLDATEKEALRKFGWEKIRTVGAEAMAMADPHAVLKALDPTGSYAKSFNPEGAAGAPKGATGSLTVDTLRPLFVAQESSGDYTAVNKDTGALGRYQVMPATGKVLADRLGVPWQPALMKQDTVAARDYQDKIGNAAIQESIDAGNGDPAAIFSHYYSGSATAYKNPAGNPKTAQYVKEMLDRVGAVEAPKGYVAQVPPLQQIDPDTGTSLNSPAPVAQEPFQHKTGIAALDELTGEEQLKLIAQSYSTTRQNNAEAKAAARVEHENRVAAYGQGQEPGPAQTSDEVGTALFGETTWGQMKGEQEAAKVGGQFMLGMGTASTAELQTKLNGLKPPSPTDPNYVNKQRVYAAAETAVRANLAERERDPVGYVYSNFPKVISAFQNAKDANGRKFAYNQLQNAYERLGIPADKWMPFQPEQVKQIAQQYDAYNPAQKLGQLDGWLSEIPPGLRSPFLQQVNKETSGHLKEDLFLYSLYRTRPDAKSLMGFIFEGQQVIREDPARKPSDAEVNKIFASSLGLQGLNPTASSFYNSAASAIYVARGGRTDGPAGIKVNTSLYEDSLRMALGGEQGNKETGFVRFRGSNEPATILPPGVDKAEWERRLQSQTLQSLTDNSLYRSPPLTALGNQPRMQDIIDEGVFVMRAPGEYAIKFKGEEGYLADRFNRLFILKVRP